MDAVVIKMLSLIQVNVQEREREMNKFDENMSTFLGGFDDRVYDEETNCEDSNPSISQCS